MITPRTLLLCLHGAGLVLGMGAAVFLDAWLLRRLRAGQSLGRGDAEVLRVGSHLVVAGLALLWVSGLGFLALAWTSMGEALPEAWRTDPALLGNPKLHAKLAVVVLLSVNGAVLHRHILPHLGTGMGGGPIGGPLGGLPRRQRALALACGAVSGSGWLYAYLLGMVRELNHVVPAEALLGAYLALLLLALAAALLLHAPVRSDFARG